MSDFTLKLDEVNKINLQLKDALFINRDNIHSDTCANWNAQPELIGQKNHIYVYTDYSEVQGVNIPALKIGDGNAYLIDSPFITGGGGTSQEVKDHMANEEIHVSEEDRAFWNNKVTCFISNGDSEALVFSKESEEI